MRGLCPVQEPMDMGSWRHSFDVFTSLRPATPALISWQAFLKRPTSIEEETSSNKSFSLFSKELFNNYKILFLGRQEDNLLPFKEKKKPKTPVCCCGSWQSGQQAQSCVKEDKYKHKKSWTLNCLGQTCDGKGQMVISGFGDWIYYLSYLCVTRVKEKNQQKRSFNI